MGRLGYNPCKYDEFYPCSFGCDNTMCEYYTADDEVEVIYESEYEEGYYKAVSEIVAFLKKINATISYCEKENAKTVTMRRRSPEWINSIFQKRSED